MRSVRDHGPPTGRQFFCRGQACKDSLLWCLGERVTALALDLYRYDNAGQEVFRDGGYEQVAHVRLTCREDPLHKLRDSRPRQGLAEGHSCMDEQLHVAIDQHDIAASTQCQRGLGLVLKIGETPWRSDGEAANACSLSISPMISLSTFSDKVRASIDRSS